MNFKKPKEEVVNDAFSAACRQLDTSFNNIKYNVGHVSPTSNIDAMRCGLEMAFLSVIKSLVENTYTDLEFEEDLNLRPKS